MNDRDNRTRWVITRLKLENRELTAMVKEMLSERQEGAVDDAPRLGRPIVVEPMPTADRAPNLYEYMEGKTEEEIESIQRVIGTALRYLRRNPKSLISVLNVRCRVCWLDWRQVIEALIDDGIILREPVIGERKGGGIKTSLVLSVAEDFA